MEDLLYTGELTQENCIEWLTGSKTATVTFPRGKYATKIAKLAEQNPDEVQICHKNKDGSVVAHIPVSYVSVRKPKKMNYSEEQLEALRKRGRENIKHVRKQ